MITFLLFLVFLGRLGHVMVIRIGPIGKGDARTGVYEWSRAQKLQDI